MINQMSPDYSDSPDRRGNLRHYRRAFSIPDHVDLSVITPYYNTGELFGETVASIQAQSLQNWEWLIVDDGSTEPESVKHLSAFAAMDERIKVIRQTNAGPSAARNRAFACSIGRYVALLDSDDMVEPTYLEKCVWFLDSNPEFAFCNAWSVVFGDQEFLWTTGFERGKAHILANSGPPISVIRRSAYEECGGFDETIRFGHEDWDFWLAMAQAGHWGYTIGEFLQWYRKRSDGRFEQILRKGDIHAQFEKSMHRKYADLGKKFPEPVRRSLLPYETIEAVSAVSNPLAANPVGRRIMFLIPWMTTGGADRVNLDLMEGLIGRGHDVTICATLPNNHSWEYEFSRFTPDIFILPNFLRASDYPRFLAYLMESRQIDTVVITGSTIGYHVLPYLRAVSRGAAFVDLCHVEEPHWLNGGHPRFGVGYQDALDLNIVTNRHLSSWMQSRGADGERIRVIYTGVRISRAGSLEDVRREVRTELNIPVDMPLIIFAGRICEQKRPALLADILRELRDQGRVFRALIIGDGEMKTELESLLDRHALADNVHMLPAVSHQRWLDILVAADIFLMPSQYEGISIALLEAMAAGVVPVVADVGGHDEILTAEMGVMIPHGVNELQEYVEALEQLLSSPSRRKQMSQKCREFAVAELSWEGMIDRFLALLDEAHQLRTDRPRYPISPGFGRELATLGLECKRLGDAVDWAWKNKYLSATNYAAKLTTSAEARAVVKFAILVAQTRLGRMVLQNHFLKTIGKRLLKKL